MGRVDQRIDAVVGQVTRKSRAAAEAADAHRHRLPRRRSSAAGERKRGDKIGTPGQPLSQQPRFRGAAENENAWHAAS